MTEYASVDYGYPWWLSYGHLPILAGTVVFLLMGSVRKWPALPMLFIGIIALWSGAAFLVDRFVIDVNGRPALPTQRFLVSGAGRVLDIGAGTGRSSIMILRARPHTTVVATDLFGESFDEHFGRSDSTLSSIRNIRISAGVDQRATIMTADMRKLPFQSGEFDAAVSAYAMDHLNRVGSDRAISEASRVLKPGGEFLLMVVGQEPWSEFAFGPLLKHGGARRSDWWIEHVQTAGFQVIEQGTRPLTFYVLARRF